MKILELFCGTKSISNIFKENGEEVYTIDFNKEFNPDLCIDINELTSNIILNNFGKPDIIWASPDCTSYSIAAISHHRNGQQPKSDFAFKSDRLVLNTLKLINHYGCTYYIENPVGMMRKMDFMKNIPRATVTYCSYGDTRMKPTDIWSNNIRNIFNPTGWNPRAKCFNGNIKCHHEAAPRGSKTGTQGLKGNYNRSKIPPELCKEILKSKIN